MKIKVKLNQIVGIICVVINLLWIIHFTYFFFAYRFCKGILWLVMIPDWILIVNMTIGIIGLYLSLLLFRNRLKMFFFLIIEFFLLLSGLLILR
jgi:hypothetical protein